MDRRAANATAKTIRTFALISVVVLLAPTAAHAADEGVSSNVGVDLQVDEERTARFDVFIDDPVGAREIGEAKFYSLAQFRAKYGVLRNPARAASDEVEKLARDRNLVEKVRGVTDVNKRSLWVRGDTLAAMTKAELHEYEAAFFQMGWTLKPLPEIGVDDAMMAVGAR